VLIQRRMPAKQMLQPYCLLWEEVMLINNSHNHIFCNKAQNNTPCFTHLYHNTDTVMPAITQFLFFSFCGTADRTSHTLHRTCVWLPTTYNVIQWTKIAWISIQTFKKLSYEDKLDILGLTTKADQRLRGDLIKAYKIITCKEHCTVKSLYCEKFHHTI